MTFWTTCFYLITLLPLGLEIEAANDPKKAVRLIKGIKAKDGLNLTEVEKNHLWLHLIYVLWAFIGLFSSQWPLFAALLILGIIPKRLPFIRCIDAIVCSFIILAIIINKIHFHYQF